MTPPIAILGAGPSGLLLARLLHLASIDFIIFERDASSASAWGRGGSGTLDIHEGTGQLALEEAGLLGDFKQKARYDVPLVVADKHGRVLLSRGHGEDTDRPEIDRRDLRVLLLNAVPDDKIRWGVKVDRVEKQSDSTMTVHFADGNNEEGFRLVVGADGAWSKARSLVTSAKPEFAGKCSITSNISPDNPLHPSVEAMVGNGNYMSMGGGRIVAAMRLGDRSYYTWAGIVLPESWKKDNEALLNDPSQLRQELVTKYFAGWPQATTDLIARSDGDIYAWSFYGMPSESLAWQTVPGVTLIGDAAHICPPSGEGVNVALYDSLQLAQQIVKLGIGRLDEATAEYERLMLPRARAMIEDSASMNDLLYAEDAPVGLLQAFGAATDTA